MNVKKIQFNPYRSRIYMYISNVYHSQIEMFLFFVVVFLLKVYLDGNSVQMKSFIQSKNWKSSVLFMKKLFI